MKKILISAITMAVLASSSANAFPVLGGVKEVPAPKIDVRAMPSIIGSSVKSSLMKNAPISKEIEIKANIPSTFTVKKVEGGELDKSIKLDYIPKNKSLSYSQDIIIASNSNNGVKVKLDKFIELSDGNGRVIDANLTINGQLVNYSTGTTIKKEDLNKTTDFVLSASVADNITAGEYTGNIILTLEENV